MVSRRKVLRTAAMTLGGVAAAACGATPTATPVPPTPTPVKVIQTQVVVQTQVVEKQVTQVVEKVVEKVVQVTPVAAKAATTSSGAPSSAKVMDMVSPGPPVWGFVGGALSLAHCHTTCSDRPRCGPRFAAGRPAGPTRAPPSRDIGSAT